MENSILFKQRNVFDYIDGETKKAVFDYAEGYMDFLANSKTERDAVKTAVTMAEKNGYVPYDFGNEIKVGGKYYFNNRGKALYLFKIGTEDIENGIRISAAHIDSPRLDLKQNPLYEDGNMAFFKTHYYGGIKKYQWLAIPLALHGVVCLRNGKTVDLVVGEDDSEPCFYVNDLLPHLGANQMSQKASEFVKGEDLNILVGSVPVEDKEEKSRIKLQVMQALNEKYGFTEEDFLSAELTLVPAYKPRDIGFDRSLIGAYGHDDKVCAYPEITAMFESESSPHTLLCILADKEETGSNGNTGMKSAVFTDIMYEISKALGANYNKVRHNSKCLSADVNAAFDPNFSDVFERQNSSYINGGVVMTKYTGARGKSGTNDASAEYVAFVRNIFDEAGVIWQAGELGKVDAGGGGTVAAYVSERNIDTVDLGVAVISMHSPFEVISKADLYMTYKALLAFNK